MKSRCLGLALFVAALSLPASALADDDEQKVTLAVEADDSAVLVERRGNVVEGWQTTFGIPVFTSTEQWEPVCAVPCRLKVSPHAAYRISGRGIASSHEFLLPKGSEVNLAVNTRPALLYSAGVAATVVGGLLVLGGVVSTYFAGNITNTDAESSLRSFGVAFLVSGGLLLAAGVPLIVTGKTSVKTTDGQSL
jgi:hypothetical protein